MRPLFRLSTIVQESQQSASRGRVLAFYRIAPCLNLNLICFCRLANHNPSHIPEVVTPRLIVQSQFEFYWLHRRLFSYVNDVVDNYHAPAIDDGTPWVKAQGPKHFIRDENKCTSLFFTHALVSFCSCLQGNYISKYYFVCCFVIMTLRLHLKFRVTSLSIVFSFVFNLLLATTWQIMEQKMHNNLL